MRLIFPPLKADLAALCILLGQADLGTALLRVLIIMKVPLVVREYRKPD